MKNEATSDYTGLTLAQIFKKRRRALGLKLSEVELSTKIRGKYLVQIESGDYAHLPHDVYSKGFVTQYAQYLKLDVGMVLAQYAKERGTEVEQVQVAAPKPVQAYKLTFTTRWLVSVALVAVVLAVLAYLSWQFSALAAAPKLSVVTPATDSVVTASVIDVKGSVNGDADVSINDSPILTDKNGAFNEQIALQEGINLIKISAKNKLGKTTTLSRNILAKTTPQSASVVVPAAVFDGIAVGVKAGSSTIAVTILVDDKEAFRGSMLPGTGQLFRGSQKVSITTTNAAATSVILTNATTANKDLGALGSDSSQRTVEFAKDTQFTQ